MAQERYGEDTGKARSTAKYLGGTDDGPERKPGKATINYYLGKAGGDPNKAKQLCSAGRMERAGATASAKLTTWVEAAKNFEAPAQGEAAPQGGNDYWKVWQQNGEDGGQSPGFFKGLQKSFDTNTTTSPSEPLLETGLKSVVGAIGSPFVHPMQGYANEAEGLLSTL